MDPTPRRVHAHVPEPVVLPETTRADVRLDAKLEATAKFLELRRQEEARIHPPIHRDLVKQVRREMHRLLLSGRMKTRVVDMVARKFQLSLEQVEVELEAMADDFIAAKVERLNNTDFHEILAGDGIRQLQVIRSKEFETYLKEAPADALPSEKDRVERRRGEAADRVVRTNAALLDVLGRVNRRFSPKNEQVVIAPGGEERARTLAEILTGQRQQEGGEDFDAEVADVVTDAPDAHGEE